MEMLRNQQIKNYIVDLFAKEREELAFVRENSKKQGLSEIAVPPHLGKLLYLLATLQKPLNILEIGTLGGYSALWLAPSLPPQGKMITLECDPFHAKIAREHIAKAGFDKKVEVREGNALELLPQMFASEEGPFDLIFIDGDKEQYAPYLHWAIKLSRPGTLLLLDNLIPKRGDVGAPGANDNVAIAIYKFNELLSSHPLLDTILITTIVGNETRVDALGLSIVKEL